MIVVSAQSKPTLLTHKTYNIA